MPKTPIYSCKPSNRNVYESANEKKPQRFKNEYLNRGWEFSEIRKREIDINISARRSAREQLHDYRNSVDKMMSFSFISKILSV